VRSFPIQKDFSISHSEIEHVRNSFGAQSSLTSYVKVGITTKLKNSQCFAYKNVKLQLCVEEQEICSEIVLKMIPKLFFFVDKEKSRRYSTFKPLNSTFRR